MTQWHNDALRLAKFTPKQILVSRAHHGIEWVLLTNAITWKVYRIKFAQPIDWDEVCCIEMGEISSRSADDLAKLYMLCRESVSTDVLKAYHRQAQILNRYVLAELVQSEPLLSILRREFRRLFDLKTSNEEIHSMLVNLVIKRDAVDGDSPKTAKATVRRAVSGLSRKQAKAVPTDAQPAAVEQWDRG